MLQRKAEQFVYDRQESIITMSITPKPVAYNVILYYITPPNRDGRGENKHPIRYADCYRIQSNYLSWRSPPPRLYFIGLEAVMIFLRHFANTVMGKVVATKKS